MAILDRLKLDAPPDVLVSKWPSDQIRLGAQLVVSESQEALFLRGGRALDLFGPGTHTLAAGNLPVLGSLISLPFGGKTPFTAEVYFVSKAVSLGQDWGTRSPILVVDPQYRVAVPLRGYGQYGLRVTNSREFVVEVVGTSGRADATTTARDMLEAPIVGCLQQAIGDALVRNRISALELPAYALPIADHVLGLLRTRFRTFGVELVNFTIESINLDPADESVAMLRRMLVEAARLDVVGPTFRRNQDFYRADRQFDVMEAAASSPGAAGSVLGAAAGLALGIGAAGPTVAIAAEALDAHQGRTRTCTGCSALLTRGARFCSSCGAEAAHRPAACPNCQTPVAGTARFCAQCGVGLPDA